MSDTYNKDNSYQYDYANKCDCRDDDNCGCTYPNNMPHDVTYTSKEHPADTQPAPKGSSETDQSSS